MYIIYRLLQPCFVLTGWFCTCSSGNYLQLNCLGVYMCQQIKNLVRCQLRENNSCLPLACVDKKWENQVCEMKKLNSCFLFLCSMSIYCRMMLISCRMSVSSYCELSWPMERGKRWYYHKVSLLSYTISCQTCGLKAETHEWHSCPKGECSGGNTAA